MSDSILAGQQTGGIGFSRLVRSSLAKLSSLPIRTLGWSWRFWRRNVDAGFVGPLFFNDMARLARRGRTNLLRCSYALALLVLLCFLIFNSFPRQSSQLWHGKDIVLSISQWSFFARAFAVAFLSVQAAAILLLTPAYLGSAIAEEKERGTAELLLTTRLSERQFVLGKLLGRLGHLGTVLLAGLPILCLTRLWGGIDDHLLVAGFAVAALSLLSCGGISILCSVLARRLLGAVIAAYSVVFILNALCLAVPTISSVRFVAAWEQQVDREWADWLEQVQSTQQFLGKDNLILTAIPLPPTPNATRILALMLAPFVAVHLTIFIFCTVLTIRVLRRSCLPLGHVIVSGAPTAREKPQTPTLSIDERVPDELHRPAPSHLLEPIHDPVLLWKEVYHAAYAGPGPEWKTWKATLWQPCLFLLLSLAAGSAFLFWRHVEGWALAVRTLNVLVASMTVFLAALTSGLLAFRSGASVSGERERQTLDALLTLPAERNEVLRSKWLGTVLRYRLCLYALATVWLLGLATGALHPLGLVLLAVVCCAQFAFFVSLGLWLSQISRNTLWSHMRLATLFLVFFCGGFLPLLDDQAQGGVDEQSLAARVLTFGIVPEHTWWQASFSWVDPSGKLTGGGDYLARSIPAVAAGTVLFGGGAWLFWRLACRRWERLRQ
jgi:ABC-type transport system involved in multi-copper enzyme maturation permease subunit